MHAYPATDFTAGTDTLSDYAISCSATKNYRYDLRPINLTLSLKQQKGDYELFPGHKAVITKLR